MTLNHHLSNILLDLYFSPQAPSTKNQSLEVVSASVGKVDISHKAHSTLVYEVEGLRDSIIEVCIEVI